MTEHEFLQLLGASHRILGHFAMAYCCRCSSSTRWFAPASANSTSVRCEKAGEAAGKAWSIVPYCRFSFLECTIAVQVLAGFILVRGA